VSGRWEMVEIANSGHVYKADLVLIALGFTGPSKTIAKELGLRMVKYLFSNWCDLCIY
jgi:NADPH-dependent glutamate synthase beta subunit-like oxidoreductase